MNMHASPTLDSCSEVSGDHKFISRARINSAVVEGGQTGCWTLTAHAGKILLYAVSTITVVIFLKRKFPPVMIKYYLLAPVGNMWYLFWWYQ